MSNTKFYISKSKIKKMSQCEKAFYLSYHKLEAEKHDTLMFMEMGKKVDELNISLYPEAGLVTGISREDKLKQTQEFLKTKDVILEASFAFNSVLVMVDLLKKNKDGSWSIYEIKSSSNSRKSMKKNLYEYRQDISIQHYVVSKYLDISSCSLLVMNKEYVYDGKEITKDIFEEWKFSMNLENDFVKVKHTANSEYYMNTFSGLTDSQVTKLNHKTYSAIDIKHIPYILDAEIVEKWIARAKEVVLMKETPDVKIGSHCKKPHMCAFAHVCRKNLNKSEINKIPRLLNKEEIYKQGLTTIRKIQKTKKNAGLLGRIPSHILDSIKTKKRVVIQHEVEKHKAFIALHKEVHYLDFEGISTPIPLWKGTSPYELIAFQYSIHTKNNKTGKLTHKEYLASGDTNPQRELAERLIKDLKGAKVVVSYFEHYEKRVIRELAEKFEDLREDLLAINDKMYDLLDVTRKGVYDPEFKGSFSLKKVAYPLSGEKSLWTGSVTNGTLAMDEFLRSVTIIDKVEKAQVRKDLLKYCEQDTLNLVYLDQDLAGLAA